eukprot:9470191-Pyramimonas_sp.AAC.1
MLSVMRTLSRIRFRCASLPFSAMCFPHAPARPPPLKASRLPVRGRASPVSRRGIGGCWPLAMTSQHY